MRVHGSCHCGAIKFTGEVDPTQVVVCHCDDCQILSGARAVFAELGYERGSVDEAAARAGVSKATVYNHFHES